MNEQNEMQRKPKIKKWLLPVKYIAISFVALVGGQGIQYVHSTQNVTDNFLTTLSKSSATNKLRVYEFNLCAKGSADQLTMKFCTTKNAGGDLITDLIIKEQNKIAPAFPLSLLVS